MLESTSCFSAGEGVRRHCAGSRLGSSRSTATERVELRVSATEYGSVTRLVSTLPVVGANTRTSYRYRAPRHEARPGTDHAPSAPRRMGTRVASPTGAEPLAVEGQTSSETDWAVGAHRENVGRAECQVTP